MRAMSPRIKKKRPQPRSPTRFFTIVKFRALPALKLSKPITVCRSLRSFSTKWEPMNPAHPVTSQTLGRFRSRDWILRYCLGTARVRNIKAGFVIRRLFLRGTAHFVRKWSGKANSPVETLMPQTAILAGSLSKAAAKSNVLVSRPKTSGG